MQDRLETIKREIAFRNNAIKKIAEMEWELPQLRDISHGLDGITFNIENLIKIIDILDQRITHLENQLGSAST